ncbi:MAG: hypothetical protein ISR45_09075 [Rhodospirillales bacterium]|nr:hypothetical protein [Rhodospirillales bacterium]
MKQLKPLPKGINQPAVLERLAKLHLRQGKIGEALVLYSDLARKYPIELNYQLHVSALLHFLGKYEEARRILESGVSSRPYTLKVGKGEPEARILRLRGIQNGFFNLVKKRKGYTIKMTGGGFSNSYLIDPGRYLSINYLVHDGNLLKDERIPPFDIIVNAIADPDIEGDSLNIVSDFIANNPDFPLINAPEQVIQTTRDNNYRRLNAIEGIIFPRTVRLSSKEYSLKVLETFVSLNHFDFPFLVREAGTQTGKSFAMVDTLEELQERLEKPAPHGFYLIEYIEDLFRGEYFRKMRFFFIDGFLYPVVCHIDQIWNVHGSNRKEFMAAHDWMLDEEKNFLSDPRSYLGEEIYSRIAALHEHVGLDFFGVDFTVTGKGDVLIYELNPAMRHSFDHARNFPYMNAHMQDITDAFNDMVQTRLAGKKG